MGIGREWLAHAPAGVAVALGKNRARNWHPEPYELVVRLPLAVKVVDLHDACPGSLGRRTQRWVGVVAGRVRLSAASNRDTDRK